MVVIDINKIKMLNALAAHVIVPDLTFYLKISPEMAEIRMGGQEKDRMEKEGVQFFEKVADGYERISDEESRFKVIFANTSIDVILLYVCSYFELSIYSTHLLQ